MKELIKEKFTLSVIRKSKIPYEDNDTKSRKLTRLFSKGIYRTSVKTKFQALSS